MWFLDLLPKDTTSVSDVQFYNLGVMGFNLGLLLFLVIFLFLILFIIGGGSSGRR